MEAGVGIEFEDRNILFKINKTKTLKENIETICKQNNLTSMSSYDLKFTYTSYGIHTDQYVTEENFHAIQDGFTLKLVESLDSVIDTIFKNMLKEREKSFNYLYTLSTDPGFIKALVKKGRDKDVLQWLTDKYLSGKELSACLTTLLHLLKKQYVKELEPAIIENIIRRIKSDSPPTPPQQLQCALAVLCQILYLRGHDSNKEIIILELSFDDLIPFIWSQEHSNLQLNTIMLINAMVKCVKGEKRLQFIKKLNKSKTKSYIFNNIIKSTKVEDVMAHELYVYQTYILSLHSESLNNYVDLNDGVIYRELEYLEDSASRSSAFVDFHGATSRSRSNSSSTILEDASDNTRISFASMESEKSSNTDTSNLPQDDQISYLTHECLLHYKKYHHKNFCQSRLEENTYKPGILISSERIIKMLAKILHIGKEPSKTAVTYHPLIFNSNLNIPFVPELFSRTMWLLSKTRREMKAWTCNDYEKALVVLEKQLKMVLESKPLDYKALISNMMEFTYNEVDKQWQKEREIQWKQMYTKHPSVHLLKKGFLAANENLVFEKRIKTLQKGDVFPKLPEKRAKQHNFFLKLSDNKRMIFWSDWHETTTSSSSFKLKEPKCFSISDIKHFVIGKACPHVKDNSTKFPDRAFSIILEEGETINFIAKDRKTANIWIDGFNLLLGKAHRSDDYKRELETLLEMDCALHLLELQDISIPNVAPPIPPPPASARPKPALPPKSPNIIKRKTLSSIQRRENDHTGSVL